MRLLSRFLTPTHLPATCDAFSAHVSVPHSKPCRKHGSCLNPCLLIRVGMFDGASSLSDCHKKAIHSSFSYQTRRWTVGWDGLCSPSAPPTPSPSDPAIDTEVDNRSNSGLVIGTAIGAAVGAAVLVVLVAVLVRRRKAEPKNKTVPTPPTPGRLRTAQTWLSNPTPAPC